MEEPSIVNDPSFTLPDARALIRFILAPSLAAPLFTTSFVRDKLSPAILITDPPTCFVNNSPSAVFSANSPCSKSLAAGTAPVELEFLIIIVLTLAI